MSVWSKVVGTVTPVLSCFLSWCQHLCKLDTLVSYLLTQRDPQPQTQTHPQWLDYRDDLKFFTLTNCTFLPLSCDLIAFWLDSWEQQKHPERIEHPIRNWNWLKKLIINFLKILKRSMIDQGLTWETVTKDTERVDTKNTYRGVGGRTLVNDTRKSWEALEKRCEDLKLLRCLVRPSLRHEKQSVSALVCREVGFVGKHGQNPKLV